MDIAVITPSLPGRHQLLTEAIQSICNQTLKPAVHAIAIDHNRTGAATLRNRLCHTHPADWYAFLDDDDLTDPHHLQTLAEHTDDADIIYTHARATHNGKPCQPWWHQPDRFNGNDLHRFTYIPMTSLVSAQLFHQLDGFDETLDRLIDHDFWLRAHNHGATFRCIPEITWTYRRGNWPSISKQNA